VVAEAVNRSLLLQPCCLPYALQSVGRAIRSVSGVPSWLAFSPLAPPFAPPAPRPGRPDAFTGFVATKARSDFSSPAS